ncbi:MAG: hypothetical protein P4L84_14890 [Isosphaeraceae bacterium]|nr:hypothetical protein [Isosphaeraceae bacterium]
MAKARQKPGKAQTSLPKPGDAFLMPLADGRFGFCHVTGLPTRGIGLAVRGGIVVETSSWVGEEAPDLNDPRLREVLVQTHHGWGPNTWRVMVRGPAPDSFQRLGTIEPRAAGPVLAVWTFWESLAREVLTQWRWDHDREALLVEEKAAAERAKAEQAEAAKRQQDALDQLTLESLRKKRRFSMWKGDRPDKAIAACRKAFGEAVDALIALGPNPKKRAVATVIRRCVEQLNSLDEQYDGFIETGEREELCREIDELVYAAGLRGSSGMADRWREW